MIKRVIVSIVIFSISIFSAVPMVLPQYEDPELISLDLKGMEIRDVLKILSQKSGLNMVADKDVKGTVSVYVKDVDVMDALDIVVSTNDLAYEEKGSLIRVMTARKYEKMNGARFKDRTKTEIVKLNYAKASTVAVTLTKMKTKLGKVIADDASNTLVLIDNSKNIERMKQAILEIDILLVTEIFSLDYAKADSIKEKLEKMLSKDMGTIRFDERTNKVVVKDTQEKINEIKKVVEAFDEKTREVLIDAKIIQVTLSDKHSYGIDWDSIATLGNITIEATTHLTTSLAGTTPNVLTIAKKGGTHLNVLRLLETFGKTNVLSRPRITVADREEAKILVGAKEVYVTSEVTTTSGGTYHTTDNVQFVDVGVTLGVTPEINSDGYVRMKIKPEVSNTDATKTVMLTNPDGSTRTVVPYVTTSEAETTVLIKDNTTLILGGLMKDTVTEYNDKVPILGDIPILGKLFSTKGKSKEKTELVIFITPHIIDPGKSTKEAEFYAKEWKKKTEDAKIGKSEKPVKKEKKSAKVKAKRKPEPKKKKEWTPVFSNKKPEKEKVVKQEKKEVVKTPYESYYLAIRKEIIGAAQRQDMEGFTGDVELQFTLDRDGFLTKGPIVLNKPDLKLVRAAVNCVKLTSPFFPFPKSLDKEEAEFYIIVRYE
ncbi:MAG: secretin N-terminal domain-containing protein [Candidatus Gorgyraea atricola]|nr:secretin N-terminal domain-containing protein [Candidatus Gorgyraea atricola]